MFSLLLSPALALLAVSTKLSEGIYATTAVNTPQLLVPRRPPRQLVAGSVIRPLQYSLCVREVRVQVLMLHCPEEVLPLLARHLWFVVLQVGDRRFRTQARRVRGATQTLPFHRFVLRVQRMDQLIAVRRNCLQLLVME